MSSEPISAEQLQSWLSPLPQQQLMHLLLSLSAKYPVLSLLSDD
jgi:hypothetical protein